jgi:hypothetical protein
VGVGRYPLCQLGDEGFQNLVVMICRELLGAAVTSFAAGPDGGKDARFEGTAQLFPSQADPASGKFIIQAKHTAKPYASCSDSDFEQTTVGREIKRIKALVLGGELDHYLLFTNRRKTGGADTRIPERIKKETGATTVWLRGEEDIEQDLLAFTKIVMAAGLDRPKPPIIFTPDDIRDVILSFRDEIGVLSRAFDSQHDFASFPGLDKKNEINGVTDIYYRQCIVETSMLHFSDIRAFLQNPRNRELAEQYHAVADELKAQLITHRAQFSCFDDALEETIRLVTERSPELQPAPLRALSRVFVHYMYADCDIGMNTRD